MIYQHKLVLEYKTKKPQLALKPAFVRELIIVNPVSGYLKKLLQLFLPSSDLRLSSWFINLLFLRIRAAAYFKKFLIYKKSSLKLIYL